MADDNRPDGNGRSRGSLSDRGRNLLAALRSDRPDDDGDGGPARARPDAARALPLAYVTPADDAIDSELAALSLVRQLTAAGRRAVALLMLDPLGATLRLCARPTGSPATPAVRRPQYRVGNRAEWADLLDRLPDDVEMLLLLDTTGYQHRFAAAGDDCPTVIVLSTTGAAGRVAGYRKLKELDADGAGEVGFFFVEMAGPADDPHDPDGPENQDDSDDPDRFDVSADSDMSADSDPAGPDASSPTPVEPLADRARATFARLAATASQFLGRSLTCLGAADADEPALKFDLVGQRPSLDGNENRGELTRWLARNCRPLVCGSPADVADDADGDSRGRTDFASPDRAGRDESAGPGAAAVLSFLRGPGQANPPFAGEPDFDADEAEFDSHGPQFEAEGPEFDSDEPAFDSDQPEFDPDEQAEETAAESIAIDRALDEAINRKLDEELSRANQSADRAATDNAKRPDNAERPARPSADKPFDNASTDALVESTPADRADSPRDAASPAGDGSLADGGADLAAAFPGEPPCAVETARPETCGRPAAAVAADVAPHRPAAPLKVAALQDRPADEHAWAELIAADPSLLGEPLTALDFRPPADPLTMLAAAGDGRLLLIRVAAVGDPYAALGGVMAAKEWAYLHWPLLRKAYPAARLGEEVRLEPVVVCESLSRAVRQIAACQQPAIRLIRPVMLDVSSLGPGRLAATMVEVD